MTIGMIYLGIYQNVRQMKLFLFVSFISSYFGNIDGIQLTKFGFLIDRTTSIYLHVK